MKILYVVLDGASDGLARKPTSLEVAHTPNMDSLASNSMCWLAYTIRPRVAPESDAAVMSLLGYDVNVYYPGRGPLEAIGAGLEMPPGSIALRANFATVEPNTMRIIDRRVGRNLTSREARILAESIDGIRLETAVARFKATIGHRGVLVLYDENVNLDPRITNTDPAYKRVGAISEAVDKWEPYVQEARPLVNELGARRAAELVNEFTRKAIEILDRHPINVERRSKGMLPANAILLRDAGARPYKVPDFSSKFGFTMGSIVEMVVEKGISRLLGIRDFSVDIESYDDRRKLLVDEARIAINALKEVDGVYVHLKGPDEPGHDGDFDEKVKRIEDIDRYFFGSIMDKLSEDVFVIVTSDHSTPWWAKSHTSDPVPVMLSNPRISNRVNAFNELVCDKAREGIIERGHMILPTILEAINKVEG